MSGLWWLFASIGGLVALGAVVQTILWLRYVPLAARVFAKTPWLPAVRRDPLDDGTNVEFVAEDGAKLTGTYLPTTAPWRTGVIAFCHELNGDRWSAIPYTEDLRRKGFDIFTFDFRNHGASHLADGYRPMPWVAKQDVADVRAAVDYLCFRGDADPRGVGLMGLSKGGSAALCAAADDRRVRAVVTDGTIPTDRMQVHFTRRFMRIYLRYPRLMAMSPDFSLRIFSKWTRLLLGRWRKCRFVNVDRVVQRVRQPVMLIHGQRDSYVPVEMIRSLRQSMANCPELWVVPEAKHNGSIAIAGSKYHRRLANFFKRYLPPVPILEPACRPTRGFPVPETANANCNAVAMHRNDPRRDPLPAPVSDSPT